MAAPQVPLKDPAFSALLAFLIPGLGHFHQRRIFKGVLYSVCILGTFFTGMRIGHGQVVYFNWQPAENRTYAYLCQFWVGLPAIPALAQARFRSSSAYTPNLVPSAFDTQFEGELTDEQNAKLLVQGQITVLPQMQDDRRRWGAKFVGTVLDGSGTSIEGDIDPGGIEPEVGASKFRGLTGTFEGHVAGKPNQTIRGRLKGTIPRPLWNYYEVPLQDNRESEMGGEPSELDRAHRALGSRFELGVVFTMIAGLLNILAIYDALEGPAYEDEEEEGEKAVAEPQPAAA